MMPRHLCSSAMIALPYTIARAARILPCGKEFNPQGNAFKALPTARHPSGNAILGADPAKRGEGQKFPVRLALGSTIHGMAHTQAWPELY
jgi:hypothetical protein